MTPSRRSKLAYRLSKRMLDLAVAVPLSGALMPVFAAISVAIRVDSNGPALFLQQRFGEGMKPFTIVKFRTLRHDEPDPHARYEMLKGDPRITRVGRFLRSTSLDELPQLFNVIAGTMSLVGPRPLVEWESREAYASHPERFDAKPGITGLSQVTVRNSEDLQGRLDADVEYAHIADFLTDLRILIQTPLSLLSSRSIYPDVESVASPDAAAMTAAAASDDGLSSLIN